MTLDRVVIPAAIYKLPIQGLYEVSIMALIYNFQNKGFRLSNTRTAKLLSVHKRTVERAISNLKKAGFIKDIGTGKNDRCLVIDTDKTSVEGYRQKRGQIPTKEGADTDILADHNKERIKKEEKTSSYPCVETKKPTQEKPPREPPSPERVRAVLNSLGIL